MRTIITGVPVQETLDTGYRAERHSPLSSPNPTLCAIVAHRRAGKTVACIADLVDAGHKVGQDGRALRLYRSVL